MREARTNCQKCDGCQPMVRIGQPSLHLYRCYGELGGFPLKKDFAMGMAEPPSRAPRWCPHRKPKERT